MKDKLVADWRYSRHVGDGISRHVCCILRNHGDVLGFKNRFSIYVGVRQELFSKRIVKDLKIDEKIYPVSYLGSVISSCKEAEEKIPTIT